MIPDKDLQRTWGTATTEERQELFRIRLEALEAATTNASLHGPLPVPWRRGWKAVIRMHGRDADGSLRASVTVSGPSLTKPYVRRVRLVRRTSLKLN